MTFLTALHKVWGPKQAANNLLNQLLYATGNNIFFSGDVISTCLLVGCEKCPSRDKFSTWNIQRHPCKGGGPRADPSSFKPAPIMLKCPQKGGSKIVKIRCRGSWMCALSLSLPLRGVRKQPTDMGLSYITSAMLLLLAINLKVIYIFEFLSYKSIA